MKLGRFYPYQLVSIAHGTEIAGQSVDWGIPSVWFPHSLAVSTEVCLAAVGQAVPDCRLGTAVSLMHWRHPLDMALTARALAGANGDRFTLGLGVSEPAAVTKGLGLPFGSALAYAREYLQVLAAGIAGGRIAFSGTRFQVDAYLPECNRRPSVLLGALGPRMAEVAGQFASGCITWLVPRVYLTRTLIPALRSEANAGREGRVVALVPFIPTESAQGVEDTLARVIRGHLHRPQYQRMLARVGLPVSMSIDGCLTFLRDQVALWGSIAQITAQIQAYAAAGVDDLVAAIYPTDPAEAAEQASILIHCWNGARVGAERAPALPHGRDGR